MDSWGFEIHNLSTHWESNLILKEVNLSFQVNPGNNMIPIMGVTGQGKSTLLYLLSALKWPSLGKVSWNFPNQSNLSWEKEGLPSHIALQLRRKVFGFVFQDSTLSDFLYVGENLCYPSLMQGIPQKEAEELAYQNMSKVFPQKSIDKIMKRYPSTLSGGERQRVSVIQAMMSQPYVIFADEPTGSLDIETRKEVMEMLKDWVNETPGQRLFVWVTHHAEDPLNMGMQKRLVIKSQSCYWEKTEP